MVWRLNDACLEKSDSIVAAVLQVPLEDTMHPLTRWAALVHVGVISVHIIRAKV